MKKLLIAAVAAVVVVGASAAGYHAYARYDGWGYGRHHSRMDPADMTAFAEAHIAALRAGLALTPEQEKLWPPVETVLRELATKQIERSEQFRAERAERRDRGRDDRRAERNGRDERRAEQKARSNPVERLRRGGEYLSETGAALTRLADATAPLYDSLDEAQRRRFDALAHAGMRRMHHQHGERHWRHHGDERGWRRGESDEGRRFDRRGEYRGDGYRHRHRERIEWTQPLPRGHERL